MPLDLRNSPRKREIRIEINLWYVAALLALAVIAKVVLS